MSEHISSTMQENRLFPPPPAFAAKAHIKSREEYERMYRESIDNAPRRQSKRSKQIGRQW